ncbi:hypothetical protein ASPZODRAFT_26979, partial [Penicilliopsis zonata CBS 506.65]
GHAAAGTETLLSRGVSRVSLRSAQGPSGGWRLNGWRFEGGGGGKAPWKS